MALGKRLAVPTCDMRFLGTMWSFASWIVEGEVDNGMSRVCRSSFSFCGFFAGDMHVTLDVTDAVAPASTGVTDRVFTVPDTPEVERAPFATETGAVF